MGTSREDIEGWFKDGKRQRATHMIVVCDSFDHEDYPVYVKGGEEKAREKYEEYGKGQHEMQRVMEVYHLGSDMRTQIDQHRSFNFSPIATPKHAGKGPAPWKKTEHESFLDRLAEHSKDARREVSGDIEWDARKLRQVINKTRELCNLVDNYIESVRKKSA